MGVHLLYFLAEPERALRAIAALLAPQGHLALGYQLRHHMPAAGRRDFTRAGHTLFDSDDDVERLVRAGGFRTEQVRVMGADSNPGGRLLLASR